MNLFTYHRSNKLQVFLEAHISKIKENARMRAGYDTVIWALRLYNHNGDPMITFKDFPLISPIAQALDTLQFDKPTEIQQKALEVFLAGGKKVDFHGQAQTGTGKTLAFGIPMIQTIDINNRTPLALIRCANARTCHSNLR